MSRIPGQRREAAELRRIGKITDAHRTLLAAGLPLEAATLLAEERRYDEALTTVLLASPSGQLDDLDPDLLLRAAEWLELLQRFSEAAHAYRLLGDEARARICSSATAVSVKPSARPPPSPAASPRPATPPPPNPVSPSAAKPVNAPPSTDLERTGPRSLGRAAPVVPRDDPDDDAPPRRSAPPSVAPTSAVAANAPSAARASVAPPAAAPSYARPHASPPAPPVVEKRSSAPPSTRPSSMPPPHAKSLEAALVAEKASEFARAAELYLAGGAPIGAVRCFMAIHAPKKALDALVRVPPTDAQYRRAVTLGVDLATKLDELGFEFDQFSAPFFETEPRDEMEVNAFYRMGLLLEKVEQLDMAKTIYDRVLRVRDSEAVRARLEGIYARQKSAREAFAKLAEQDEVFRSKGGPAPAKGAPEETFPSLPEIQLPNRPRRGGPPKPASEPPKADEPLLNVFNIAEGTTIARRYKVERILGRGGMGAVYRARDLELDEELAIKVFAHGTDDATLVSRFKLELSLARQISHQNVIRLYDFGQQGLVPFITMELLSGIDLADEMDRGRDLHRDLGFLIQACHGLQCVHERGVVHRDLKPENLFVTTDGVVKLMDFGIAKRSSTQGNLTQQGFTAGTPAYMAPEQAEDFANATHLADIYSMGVIAYRMFTGALPFDHENPMTLLMKHIQELPRPPREIDPSIPDELEYIVLQLLEKRPEARIQSCAELAQDLSRLRSSLDARHGRRPPR